VDERRCSGQFQRSDVDAGVTSSFVLSDSMRIRDSSVDRRRLASRVSDAGRTGSRAKVTGDGRLDYARRVA
jgi:hypothetical protein